MIPALQVPQWASIPQLVHGFYGRRGGVSRGPFAELNLSQRVGDEPAAVQQNWEQLGRATGGSLRFVTMQQVHGAQVHAVEDPRVDPGEADGLVTSLPGLGLGVLTADCVPILLVTPRQHAVVAVHAGWRGTVAGIAQRAVQYLQQHCGAAPESIEAALGPAIGGCCYEVDHAITAELQDGWGAMPDAVHAARNAKPRLDLRRANATILERAGVRPAYIRLVGPCTRCAAADYFSYRAAHGTTGRQLSFIGWQQ